MIAGYEFGHRLPEEDRKLFQFARTEQFEPLGSEIVSEVAHGHRDCARQAVGFWHVLPQKPGC